MNGKGVILALLALIVLVVIFGAKHIHVLRHEIDETNGRIAELDKKLEALSKDERTLTSRRVQEVAFAVPPGSDDPVVNRALLRRFIGALLERNGLTGSVVVKDKVRDKSFPPMVEVNAVPIEIGIQDYALFGQVIGFVEELRKFPMVVEGACLGCSDIGVPGRIRLRLKYFVVPS